MLISAMATLFLMASLAMNEPTTPEQAVALAKETVSQQLHIPADQLALESVKGLDWPDSSLGCPQPGMMYAQMITPGFKVVLTKANAQFAVHIGGGRAVICGGLGVSSLGPKGKSAKAKLELIQRAREKLSATLQIDMEKVVATTVRPSKPGCGDPAPAAQSTQVYMEYEGRHFVYDSVADQTRECDK